MILDYGPNPTKDVAQGKKDLSKFGFCLIEKAITGEFFKKSKERLLEQAAAEEEMGLSFRDGGPDQTIKMTGDKIDKSSFSKKMVGLIRDCGCSLIKENALETWSFILWLMN